MNIYRTKHEKEEEQHGIENINGPNAGKKIQHIEKKLCTSRSEMGRKKIPIFGIDGGGGGGDGGDGGGGDGSMATVKNMVRADE